MDDGPSTNPAAHTASLATFRGDALTDLLAGLAANSIGSFVNGLIPLLSRACSQWTSSQSPEL
jgi:hypothetical protein